LNKKLKKLTKISDLCIGKLYIVKEHKIHIFKNIDVGDYTTIDMLNYAEPFLLLEISSIIDKDRFFSCRILTKDNCIGWISILIKELEFANIHI
jgi:hypothetical protein